MTLMQTYEESALKPSQFAARYAELCALRDKVNAANVAAEAELADLVKAQEELRVKAQALADKIDDTRGREAWIAMKRELRVLAQALGRPR